MATTHITHTHSFATGQQTRTVFEAGAARVVSLWNAVKNRRSVSRLLEWDDRMLSDIGLTQGDVRSALSGRLNEDPSNRLDALSGERRYATRATARERRRLGF